MTSQTAPRSSDRTLALGLVDERWIPLVGHLVFLALVAVLARPTAPSRLLGVWAAVIVLIVAARGLWSTYARHAGVTSPAIVRATRITMTALGLAWGAGTVIVAQYLPLVVFSTIVMGLAGLLAGAINTLLTDRWAFPLYAVSLFGPTLTASALRASGRTRAIEELLIVLFVAFMIIQHRRAHDGLVQRLRVEDELRTRERQLGSAQAIAHVGSWEWDMKTNIVTWSDELRRLYGLPPDAPAGYAEFLALVHPDDRARLEALVAEGVQTRRTIDYDWRVVRPDGEVRHLQARNVVITDETGRPIRLAGTSLDVTERKLAEERLRATIAEVKVLQGMLPICASCKRIRTDDGQWQAVESYVRDRTNAEFTHGLCPECAKKDWG